MMSTEILQERYRFVRVALVKTIEGKKIKIPIDTFLLSRALAQLDSLALEIGIESMRRDSVEVDDVDDITP